MDESITPEIVEPTKFSGALSTEFNLSDLHLEKTDSSRLKVEVNLGLALPFKFYQTGDFDKTKKFNSIVRSVKDDGTMVMLGLTTQSRLGPLGGFDNDVLTILLSMAYEQRYSKYNSKNNKNGIRVYFTLAEVCRRLGLSPNSRHKVKESVERIYSQELTTKNFIFSAVTKDTALNNEKTKIILSFGNVRYGKTSQDIEDFNSTFYVDFNVFIVENLYNEYVSIISSKNYLGLKSGPERRTLIFLMSKRKTHGDQFLFKLSELADVLGITDSIKRRRSIGDFLKRIQTKLKSIDFEIKKKKGSDREDWDILITFNEDQKKIEANYDPFYAALLAFYGSKSLEGLDLEEIDIMNYREEFSLKYKKLNESAHLVFGREEVCAGEFALDITLYQILKKDYQVHKSFKALSKAILMKIAEQDYEIPEGYRYFIYKRLSVAEKEATKKLIDEKLAEKKASESKDRENLEKSFNLFYGEVAKSNKGYISKLRKRVLKDQDLDEELPTYNMMLERGIRDLARSDFESGEILNQHDGGRLLN